MFNAGIARIAITPPVGLPLLGYAGRQGLSEGTETDLFATALVLATDHTRVAILGLDLGLLTESHAAQFRTAIAQRLDTPVSHVLLNASHTHSGPTLPGLTYDDDRTLAARREVYARELERALVEVAGQAAARLQPARVGTGTGEARIGVHRRELLDGMVILGEDPAGPVDHEVRVLRVDDLAGRPIAVLFAHGCHTVTMGPKSMAWSSDYVGPARDLIEQATGCPSLFLQANGGDINPITGIGPAEDDRPQKQRLGQILGAEVVKTLAAIHTDSVRGPRVFFGTMAKASIYPRLPLTDVAEPALVARERTFTVPFLPLPDPATVRGIVESHDAEVARLVAEGAPLGRVSVAHRWRQWAHALGRASASGEAPVMRPSIQAIQIGPLAIAAYPGETFSTLGLEVKRRSPIADTVLVGYSNGGYGYVPTRDAFPPEGWSVTGRYGVPDMLPQAYLLPMAPVPEYGDMVVDQAVALIAEIAGAR